LTNQTVCISLGRTPCLDIGFVVAKTYLPVELKKAAETYSLLPGLKTTSVYKNRIVPSKKVCCLDKILKKGLIPFRLVTRVV